MKLYPYQEEGVRFLMSVPPEIGFNHKLLADEQGLGKTAQAIVAAQRLKAQRLLIICPASVKYNWARQLVLWGFCDERQIRVVGTLSDLIMAVHPVVIVNYDLLVSPSIRAQLLALRFDIGIFDEAHRLKSAEAKRSHNVLGGKGVAHICRVRWALTGTPVPNRPIEFYFILATMARNLLGQYGRWVDFGRRFCSGFVDKNTGTFDPDTRQKWNFKGASNIEELRQRLKPFMLRRELKEVYHQLPEMIEETVYIEVSLDSHPEIIEQKNNEFICRTGPFDPEQEMPLSTIRRIIAECKVDAAFQYIEDTLQSIDKLVVFTYHRKVTESLAALAKRYKPVVLYGGVDAVKKQSLVDTFIQDDQTRLFIGQITASGEGIDGLQHVCHHVLFVELDWSAGGMAQAKSRLYRIGQNHPVQVQYLIAGNTLEMVIARVLENKGNVINRLLQIERKPMSLEATLERLAQALEANTAALTGNAVVATKAQLADDDLVDDTTAKTKPGRPKAKAETKGPSLDDLKEAAQTFCKVKGATKKQCKQIVKKVSGADSLTEVAEADFQATIEALKKAGEDLASGGEDEDDGFDLD